MKSMTGYAHVTYEDQSTAATIEIKSYNNRFLDLYVLVPPEISPLEPRIREYIRSRVARGRVEVSVRLSGTDDDELAVDVDRAVRYHCALRELSDRLGLGDQVDLGHVLSLEGVLQRRPEADVDALWDSLLPALEKAHAAFDHSRETEGATTRDDLLAQLSALESGVSQVEAEAANIESHVTEGVKNRFQEVLGDNVDLRRVYEEAAMLLVRFSINEEIVRLRSHSNAFKEGLGQAVPVGKRLDFMAQEMLREVNTIGSKSPDVVVSQAVIQMKERLENIREQLRNVE